LDFIYFQFFKKVLKHLKKETIDKAQNKNVVGPNIRPSPKTFREEEYSCTG
jgi:hypothetical protein